jgi:hypothetical protein
MLHIIKLYLNCNCNFRACYNAKVEVVKQLVALTGPDSLIKENLFGVLLVEGTGVPRENH